MFKGKMLNVVIAATMSLSMIVPPVAVYAEDIGADYNGANSAVIDTNNGTVTDNTGKIDKNVGSIDDNKGIVNQNRSGATITTNSTKDTATHAEGDSQNGGVCSNSGTIGTNNGSVEYNNADGIITINSSAGIVVGNMGTIGTNAGTLIDNMSRPGGTPGTVTTNTGTIRENNGLVSENNGEIVANNGTVVNGSSGVVDENWGGSVSGDGKVLKNFGNATVAAGVEIVQQFWNVATSKFAHLKFNDTSSGGKSDVVLASNSAWLWEDGATIIKPADDTKTLKSVTLQGNGATLIKNEDGTYRLSGITKDVVLLVLFEGESEPKPVVVHVDDKKEDNKVENKQTQVVTPVATAVLPTSMPATVPAAPSAIVEKLAPVINFAAEYGAVDLNGTPIVVDVKSTGDEATREVYKTFMTNVLAQNGIQAKEVVTAHVGTIKAPVANSVMSYRITPMKGMTLYVCFKSADGKVTYVRPKINADGTISFEVPFADCEFSIVEAK